MDVKELYFERRNWYGSPENPTFDRPFVMVRLTRILLPDGPVYILHYVQGDDNGDRMHKFDTILLGTFSQDPKMIREAIKMFDELLITHPAYPPKES
jgi:hypothetical protein